MPKPVNNLDVPQDGPLVMREVYERQCNCKIGSYRLSGLGLRHELKRGLVVVTVYRMGAPECMTCRKPFSGPVDREVVFCETGEVV